MWWEPRRGWPATLTSRRRRRQPFPPVFVEARGGFPGTVPFPALIDTRPREEAFCPATCQYGAIRVCGPHALSPGSSIVYFELDVLVSHCWCLCEHSYKSKFPLKFHLMPVLGKSKVYRITPMSQLLCILMLDSFFPLVKHGFSGERRVHLFLPPSFLD
jgi:hypothetical protein